jgi:hypothetical protein
MISEAWEELLVLREPSLYESWTRKEGLSYEPAFETFVFICSMNSNE